MPATSKVFLVALAVLPTVFVASESDAGTAPYTIVPTCTKASDGSGSCYGTLSGFHDAPGGWADGSFANINGAYVSFGAYLQDQVYTCVAPTSNSAAMAAAAAGVSTYYFYVAWNAQGQCTSVSMQTSSRWQ